MGRPRRRIQEDKALPSFYASGKIIAEILKREGQIDASAIEGTFDASFVALCRPQSRRMR